MSDAVLEAAATEIRRMYDRCAEAIMASDPDGFVAAFGPAGRSVTPEGAPVTFAETRDYIAWRMGRTVTAHSFVVELNSVEGSPDEVWVGFTEDSSATVLDISDRPVVRNAHSVNRVLWRREDGAWNQVAGEELEVDLMVDGMETSRDSDPVGVSAYRIARSRES